MRGFKRLVIARPNKLNLNPERNYRPWGIFQSCEVMDMHERRKQQATVSMRVNPPKDVGGQHICFGALPATFVQLSLARTTTTTHFEDFRSSGRIWGSFGSCRILRRCTYQVACIISVINLSVSAAATVAVSVCVCVSVWGCCFDRLGVGCLLTLAQAFATIKVSASTSAALSEPFL